MYTARTGLILGFHGTDLTVALKALEDSDLTFKMPPSSSALSVYSA